MIMSRISKLGIIKSRLFLPVSILTRSKRCSSNKNVCSVYMPKKKPSCPPPTCCDTSEGSHGSERTGGGDGGERTGGSKASGSFPQLIRPMKSGKCRLGFIPDEWFLFFRTKTGVTGPYLLILGITNYLVSKEIYVMEHEYYSGLSILLVVYYITTRYGKQIGAALDKQVDEKHATFQIIRDNDKAYYKGIIKDCEMSQISAKGQKELMAAKKENIALQLEAAYRERVMMVYKAVRGRMEYHIRRHRVESLIEQRWMVQWIVKKVHESITPEFRKRAFESAILELDAIASRTK